MNPYQEAQWPISEIRLEPRTAKDMSAEQLATAREGALVWAPRNGEIHPSRYGCHWCGRSWTEPAGHDRWMDGVCRQKNHHAIAEPLVATRESVGELVEVG